MFKESPDKTETCPEFPEKELLKLERVMYLKGWSLLELQLLNVELSRLRILCNQPSKSHAGFRRRLAVVRRHLLGEGSSTFRSAPLQAR